MSSVIESAAARGGDVFAAVSTAASRQDAIEAVARLLAVDPVEAETVLRAPLVSFVGISTDLPAGDSSHGFSLHPFRDRQDHSALFHARCADSSSATGGQWDEDTTETERRAGLERIEDESAMWFVAVDTARGELVGLVFGEESGGGDIDVAIWVLPEERRKGYGIHALRECRRELASFFPGKNLVVRAPLSPGR